MADDTNAREALLPIDYEALIAASWANPSVKGAQGTPKCIAFAKGAEWFRAQCLAATPADRGAPAEGAVPMTGSWIAAEDVRRSARAIDVALNGEANAARAPALIDVESQITGLARTFGKPIVCALIDAPTSQAGRDALDALSQAERDLLAERRRQVEVKGWTPEHDDEHAHGGMARAAASYALKAASHASEHPGISHWLATAADKAWPWDPEWWKPRSERRMLVKAGALILAEIERLDRAALASSAQAGQGEQA